MSNDANKYLQSLAKHNLPPIPDGWYLVIDEGLVEQGDRWSYFGGFSWLESRFVGHEKESHNFYIRKVTKNDYS